MRKPQALKFLFILTAVVILLQQVFNYIYIKRLDKKYSTIITNKLEVLKSFEITSTESAVMQHAVVSLVHNQGKGYDSVIKRINQSSLNIQNQFARMRRHAISPDENASVDSLSAIFGIYTGKCNSDITMVKTAQVNPATSAQLVADLRETYNDLINEQIKQTSFFVRNGERISDEISANTNKTSIFIFAVGILPFLVLSLILVLAGLTLFVLGSSVNWFRNLE